MEISAKIEQTISVLEEIATDARQRGAGQIEHAARDALRIIRAVRLNPEDVEALKKRLSNPSWVESDGQRLVLDPTVTVDLLNQAADMVEALSRR